ncbi:MAG: glycoside hydrolase family 2 TIM barrel-domain containing protein [Prolixibacteraceae bacterium]|nr:glycoside hydrolase family 2 TIM barrel-domain containing protein [Prolixibacteraceae bacterium]
MNSITSFLMAALLLFAAACSRTETSKIDLSGEWFFAIDSFDMGIDEKWYSGYLNERVLLPGSMNSNGKGEDVNLQTEWTGQIVDSSFFKKPEYSKYRQSGNFKIPFWLQPLKHYQGAAWYQKKVNIPSGWEDKQISLFLERCHWESRLWIDDQEIGMSNSLGTPHIYDLTGKLEPGNHLLTLCVDNRVKSIDPGVNSHSISDHTQSNWNGIVGELFLEARPLVKLQSVQVFPDVAEKQIFAKVSISNLTENQAQAELTLQVSGAGSPEVKIQKVQLEKGENQVQVEVPLGEKIQLWDEFNPNLYQLKAILSDQGNGLSDTLSTTFGMRSFAVNGKHIEINGRPVFLRGTLECCIFPKTGYPPTDEAEWARIFSICRAHGLNHVRFHSWCPPEAAFAAADKAGFYLQVECSSWANQSTTIGDGKPFDKYLYEESERMVQIYGNHPSFCMMLYGNEPGGKNQNDFLGEFVSYWKNKDNRRIYTSGAGWPLLEINDYLSTPNPRIQRWGEGLKSIINAQAPRTDYDWSDFTDKYSQPVVSHEIGQWCVYPNFREIAKYDGVLRAKNFEIFQETLKEHGMEQLADSFLLASGKLQALCYKADIEAALRTKDFGGFQLLDLHDFPGQGTALVGVLDPFWGEKGYISPQEYSRFCNSTVPLARMKKRVFTNNETFEAAVEVAHYGEKPITACVPEWKVTGHSGAIFQSGKFAQSDISVGNGIQLGTVSFPLTSVVSPEKLTFEISVGSFSNSWDFWVYPAKKENIEGEQNIRVVQNLDDATRKYLADGGSVLLTLKKGTLSAEMGGDIQIGFSSIFWNTAWTRGQAPHTLGILCNPKHPALAAFPTEYHSNWQWWDAMSHSGAINISSFPSEIKPIVRVIDDWFTNRPLALLFEGKVGKGKILISGIDLLTDAKNRPEAQQILFSLKKYMAGEKFNPEVEIEVPF